MEFECLIRPTTVKARAMHVDLVAELERFRQIRLGAVPRRRIASISIESGSDSATDSEEPVQKRIRIERQRIHHVFSFTEAGAVICGAMSVWSLKLEVLYDMTLNLSGSLSTFRPPAPVSSCDSDSSFSAEERVNRRHEMRRVNESTPVIGRPAQQPSPVGAHIATGTSPAIAEGSLCGSGTTINSSQLSSLIARGRSLEYFSLSPLNTQMPQKLSFTNLIDTSFLPALEVLPPEIESVVTVCVDGEGIPGVDGPLVTEIDNHEVTATEIDNRDDAHDVLGFNDGVTQATDAVDGIAAGVEPLATEIDNQDVIEQDRGRATRRYKKRRRVRGERPAVTEDRSVSPELGIMPVVTESPLLQLDTDMRFVDSQTGVGNGLQPGYEVNDFVGETGIDDEVFGAGGGGPVGTAEPYPYPGEEVLRPQSYEQYTAERMETYRQGREAMENDPDVMERLEAWQDHMVQVREAESQRSKFDIHACKAEIMNAVSSGDTDFKTITAQLDRRDAMRSFVTVMHLADSRVVGLASTEEHNNFVIEKL